MSKKSITKSSTVKGFLSVSQEAFKRLRTLGSAANKLYNYLIIEANEGRVIATQKELSAEVGVSDRTIRTAISELVEAGLIVMEATYPMSLIRVVEAFPHLVPDLVPGLVPHSLPHSLPHSVPGSLPGSLPGLVPDSLPDSVPHSTPSDPDYILNNINTNTSIDLDHTKPKTEEQKRAERMATPRPWPEVGPDYFVRISDNEEADLMERFGAKLALSTLESISHWLLHGETATAKKARNRKSHYATAIEWIKREKARNGNGGAA